MKKKIASYLVLGLLALNVLAWQEVFAVAGSSKLLKVYFLNVGQGDCAFVETPEHHQILIDGGPDASVLPKLDGLMPQADRTIDMVILSHPEKDHFFGLIEVLKRYKADYIVWNGIKRDTPEYKQWISELAEQEAQGAHILAVSEGQQIKAGNVLINVLSPQENLAGRELKDSNESSVVLNLTYGSEKFLFTGDIGFSTEAELEENYSLKANVLKIAHHGSKYSTSADFLQEVMPEYAVISDAKNNTYGHPSQEVLQKLDNSGIKVLRTDTLGDIEFVTEGKNIQVK